MANDEERRPEVINGVAAGLKRLTDLDINSTLAELSAMSTQGFGEFAGPLERVQILATYISDVDLRVVWTQKLFEIIGRIGALESSLHPDPKTNVQWPSLRATLAKTALELSMDLLPIAAYAAGTKTAALEHFEKQGEEARQRMNSVLAQVEQQLIGARQQSQDIETSTSNRTKEVDALIDRIRKTSAVASASVHATEFEQLATDHAEQALNWMVGTIFTAVVAAGFLGFFFAEPLKSDAKPAVIAQYALTRAAVLLMSSYAILWCARNYRAHRHLNVVNRHRMTALRTFETFHDAGTTPDVKNAVLLETTRSIFTVGITGYLGTENESGGAERVVEIFKAASGGDK
jgi:hypothetical protein